MDREPVVSLTGNMFQTDEFLMAVGGILLLGLATEFIGKRTFLPRVTLLVLLGVLIGDEVLGLVPKGVIDRFDAISTIALLMVGFLLGGKLTLKSLKHSGPQVFWVSLVAALGTTILVTLSLYVISVPVEIALLLGCIAAATAPAAVVDVVQEAGEGSHFSKLLIAIVAIDDAWAILLFSTGMAAVTILNGVDISFSTVLLPLYEIGGGIALGVALGFPSAYLTGRLRPGRPMLTEALGLVLVCGGIAMWLDVSFLIASMTMGFVTANFAKHHEFAFHEIENIEWPFMALFFVLAGATLEVSALAAVGATGVTYLMARIVGKLAGAWLGAWISHSGQGIRRWMGVALLPQAGVAIGMGLMAANRFPEYQQVILSLVISTTVVFELFGPVATRLAIKNASGSH